MKTTRRALGGLIGLILILCTVSVWAEVVVIGYPGIAVDSLSAKQVKKIWLGKSKRIPAGRKAKVVDQKLGSDVRDEFYEKAVKKTDSQLKAYWAKAVFTGKGVPPTVLDDDEAVKEWVMATPGGLGYVDSGSVDVNIGMGRFHTSLGYWNANFHHGALL